MKLVLHLVLAQLVLAHAYASHILTSAHGGTWPELAKRDDRADVKAARDAAFGVVVDSQGRSLCAAVLANNEYAFAAASCFSNVVGAQVADEYQLVLHQSTTADAPRVPIGNVVVHPHYDQETFANNVAYVQFESNTAVGNVSIGDWPADWPRTLLVDDTLADDTDTWNMPMAISTEATTASNMCAKDSTPYGLGLADFFCSTATHISKYNSDCGLPYALLFGADSTSTAILGLYSHSSIDDEDGFCGTGEKFNYYILLRNYIPWLERQTSTTVVRTNRDSYGYTPAEDANYQAMMPEYQGETKQIVIVKRADPTEEEEVEEGGDDNEGSSPSKDDNSGPSAGNDSGPSAGNNTGNGGGSGGSAPGGAPPGGQASVITTTEISTEIQTTTETETITTSMTDTETMPQTSTEEVTSLISTTEVQNMTMTETQSFCDTASLSIEPSTVTETETVSETSTITVTEENTSLIESAVVEENEVTVTVTESAEVQITTEIESSQELVTTTEIETTTETVPTTVVESVSEPKEDPDDIPSDDEEDKEDDSGGIPIWVYIAAGVGGGLLLIGLLWFCLRRWSKKDNGGMEIGAAGYGAGAYRDTYRPYSEYAGNAGMSSYRDPLRDDKF